MQDKNIENYNEDDFKGIQLVKLLTGEQIIGIMFHSEDDEFITLYKPKLISLYKDKNSVKYALSDYMIMSGQDYVDFALHTIICNAFANEELSAYYESLVLPENLKEEMFDEDFLSSITHEGSFSLQ